MKRYLTVLLMAMIVLSLVGCQKQAVNPIDESQVSEEESQIFDDVFQLSASMTVSHNDADTIIVQKQNINGREFSLIVNLEKSAGYTSKEELVICTKIFWYSYPLMYERFAVSATPTNVNLFVENEGYEIAETWDNNIHLHDQYLGEWPEDYDCLTHELAHIIQSGWEDDYMPWYEDDAYLVERFADYCRYVYSYKDGLYNDEMWTLQNALDEYSYSTSNRFWVWLDYKFSTDEIDIMKRIAEAMHKKDEAHSMKAWSSKGRAWDEMFKDTGAFGKSLDELWKEYVEEDFAMLDANRPEGKDKSDLLKAYDIRNTILKRK